MIVLDASAAVELFLHSDKAAEIAKRIHASEWCIPHLLDLEVLQTLRRLLRLGEVDEFTVGLALKSLSIAPFFRFEHKILAARIWALRDNLTAYDGAYIALAEHLDAPLVTCDAKLAIARIHRARVEVF